MNKVKVHFENCYGIKKLKAEFDFQTAGPVFAIYAPNGVMKTSFVNAFRDLSLVRIFRQCLEQNPAVLPELANPKRLKQKLWVAYLRHERSWCDNFSRIFHPRLALVGLLKFRSFL